MTMDRFLFSEGDVKYSPGYQAAMKRVNAKHKVHAPIDFLLRHLSGDWGDLKRPKDHAANDLAVIIGGQIRSEYNLPDGTRVLVITDADQSVTTLLLPEEY